MAVVLWPHAALAAWTATAAKGESVLNGGDSRAVSITGTTAGSLIVGCGSFWSASAPATVTVSDGVNGAYTQAFYGTRNSQGGGMWYFKNHAGGNVTVTFDPAGTNVDMWVAVQEFTGNDTASQPSGTPVSTTGTSTTASTSNLSGLDNDVLLIACEAADLNGVVTENAGGEGFTLSNEAGTSAEQNGSLVYKIISGAPGTVSESWTLGSSTDWIAGIAAFKAAGGGGGGGGTVCTLSLMGVGKC